MKYAVFEVSGNQYKAGEGEELYVQGLKIGDKSTDFDKVLLLVDEENVVVGNPYIEGASVKASIIGEEKGDKVRILKYKAKSRYRRRAGFRPKYVRIKVEKLTSK